MKRYFISGGTTGKPRSICHNLLDWQIMVIDTAFVLQALGVSNNDTVLIAQPSFPWSIGNVFADAVILCGANSICYGLYSNHTQISTYWETLSPSVIVAPPTLVIKWLEAGIKIPSDTLFITVGEPLTPSQEKEIWLKLKPRSVRRIYGHSEIGTLGYQPIDHQDTLCMNPRFSYSFDDGIQVILENEGCLSITPKYTGKVIHTKDIVKVKHPIQNAPIWNDSLSLQFRMRNDSCLFLSDGTRIFSPDLNLLLERFSFHAIQLEISIHKDCEILLFRYVSQEEVNDQEIIAEVLKTFPELENYSVHGVFGTGCIKLLRCSLDELHATERGKVPLVVDKRFS